MQHGCPKICGGPYPLGTGGLACTSTSNSLAALQSVDWIYTSQQADSTSYGPVLQGILRRANEFPIDHDLKIWSLLVERVRDSKQLQIEDLEVIIANLPLDWWALLAPELLTNLLSEESSMDWLFDNPIPWSAAILRPKANLVVRQGRDRHHPGCSPEIRNSLARGLGQRVKENPTRKCGSTS